MPKGNGHREITLIEKHRITNHVTVIRVLSQGLVSHLEGPHRADARDLQHAAQELEAALYRLGILETGRPDSKY
jgi:hypothetical protein